MEKPLKISIDFTFQEYLDQAERIKKSNRIMFEKIKNDFEEGRKTLREKYNIPLSDENEHLTMVG